MEDEYTYITPENSNINACSQFSRKHNHQEENILKQ